MNKFELSKVEEEKKEEIRRLRERKSLGLAIKEREKEGKKAIISEVKRKSPSQGKIKEVDVGKAAVKMEKGGACAISVLTDRNFGGSLEDLRKVKKRVTVPVLRKDFLVEDFQLEESYALGADAVLLIASLLKEKTKEFIEKAMQLGMEALVEVHDEEHLKFTEDAKIVGVNNRNLNNLEVNLEVSERIIPKIPEEKIKVSESGIKNRKDLKRVFDAGAEAALIGTSIMEGNMEEEVRKFVE